jgi:soluble lytic murein transglycosylase-like protein
MLAVLCAVAATPCRAAPAALETLDQSVCRTIERSAQTARLPVEFVTRVIWRESSFRPGVISRAGAEGIAQFMPSTAQTRGLADPFDPEQAIPKAARYLADLRQRFGKSESPRRRTTPARHGCRTGCVGRADCLTRRAPMCAL